MIRTAEEYRQSRRDGPAVCIYGEPVKDVPTYPRLRPVVDIRSRICDMLDEQVIQTTSTSVTGLGGFLGTMAAAVIKQSA